MAGANGVGVGDAVAGANGVGVGDAVAGANGVGVGDAVAGANGVGVGDAVAGANGVGVGDGRRLCLSLCALTMMAAAPAPARLNDFTVMLVAARSSPNRQKERMSTWY